MRVIVTNLCLLLAIPLCLAQGDKERSDKQIRPDLSGTWTYPKSSVGEGRDKITDYVLTIVQSQDEVRIVEKYTQRGRNKVNDSIYYTDGKPRATYQKNAKISETVAKWVDQKLTIRHKSYGDLNFVFMTTIEWEISKDGKTLTQATTYSGAIISPRRKVKYVRAN